MLIYPLTLAELICKVDLIIWDEVPMQDKFCQEAVDLTFRDIRGNENPFGGVAVVFGGDFQQILPVVVKETRGEIVGECLQHSHLWGNIKVLKLKENVFRKQYSGGKGFCSVVA